jgi:hypothetical protein
VTYLNSNGHGNRVIIHRNENSKLEIRSYQRHSSRHRRTADARVLGRFPTQNPRVQLGTGSANTPAPEISRESVQPDTPLRLAVAIKLGFPAGGMTVSGLRREVKRGRLKIEVIANKQFTTLRAIEEMREKCRVEVRGHTSGIAKNVERAESSLREELGLLSITERITPQAALLARIEKRKSA